MNKKQYRETKIKQNKNTDFDIIRNIIKWFCCCTKEIILIFLAATCAIWFTSAYDNSKDKQNAVALLSITCNDMQTQADLLQQTLIMYENKEIDIQTLRLNASINLDMVEEVYLSKYMIEMTIDQNNNQQSIYAVILSAYRQLVSTNEFLTSDTEATDAYIISLCRDTIDSAYLLSEIMGKAVQYHENEIDNVQFQEWVIEYISKYKESHSQYIWSTNN